MNGPPTVAITSPANNAVFAAPASVTVTASAADADGTIAKVDFYQGGSLIGTATTSPYSATVSSLGSGAYSFTAIATDNQGAATTSAAVTIRVNALPTVSITSPTAGALFTAPASITITATATDSDGTIQRVDFYRGGTTLIGTATTAPYGLAWTNVAQGSYALTAVATDDLGGTTTSAAVTINVSPPQPKVFYIHADHRDVPRAIFDQQQQLVWRWDTSEPFGANPPDENPSALGVFKFPLRDPGQYDDPETGNFQNGHRDYSSVSGRYQQADPIGLAFDFNLYAYVKSSPLLYSDSLGLAPGDKTYGLPKDFWNWYHRNIKRPGDPDVPSREAAKKYFDEWDQEGRPGPDKKRTGKRGPRFPRGGGGFGLLLCIPDIVDEYCKLNPGDPACLIVNPPDPKDPCRGIPNCI